MGNSTDAITILNFMRSGHKKIMAGFWIFIAIGLIIVGRFEQIRSTIPADLKKYIPAASEMVTSPAVHKLIDKEALNDMDKKTDTIEIIETKTKRPSAINEDRTGATITIAKIGANIPIVIANTNDQENFHRLLDKGVVVYPGSAGFGNVGQTVLIGHSAPANWPNIKYDTAFSRIIELISGDKIKIDYFGKIYIYSVVKTQIIEKGSNIYSDLTQKSTLVLLTCWPPGRDLQRLAVEAVLISE